MIEIGACIIFFTLGYGLYLLEERDKRKNKE
jgi:hypothetical protein